MTRTKISAFKKTLEGMEMPVTQRRSNGDVGNYVEEQLKKQGIPIDSGTAGADVAAFDLEIKTRKRGSNAPITVGSMSLDRILRTDYNNSTIKEKLQTVRSIEYDENSIFHEPGTSVVKEDTVIDLTDPEIQKILEFQYEYGRLEVMDKFDWPVHTTAGWWEKKDNTTWAFRIPFSNWKNFKKHSQTRRAYNTMFTNG